jgi:hypothetical protein
MKNINHFKLFIIFTVFASVMLFISCSEDHNNEEDFIPIAEETVDEETNTGTELNQADYEALVFMLEEEKLARDTYEYLDNIWSLKQFANIKLSEQTHMNLVTNLLETYKIEYNLLPTGEFQNQNLQELYNQFVVQGKIDLASALQIGATIEDLDIVDLENFINITTNASIKDVFENLQCGSRNHLRSFIASIEKLGDTYTPQFLTENEYKQIINSSREQCK